MACIPNICLGFFGVLFVDSGKIELINLLEEKQERNKRKQQIKNWVQLYDWQRDFVASTKSHSSCCLCAANRVGKTMTGVLMDSYHLTGDYPDDWKGYKFDFPPLIWLLGVTGEKTRDLLQAPLFGRVEASVFTGGLIPADKIVSSRSMTGTSGAMREVRVKHALGVSTVQFWSYSQGQGVLMGDSLDWYHIDEEPKDQTIYPQVLTRTATGDEGKGGRGILTFTPENGRTETVIGFMDRDIESQFFMNKGWDDAPHLTEETKKALLEKFPVYQRDMRSKGIPLMGAGLIYAVSEDDIKCEPFEIPDYWFVINGMDFGWDHPQAHVQLVWDRDADIFYLVNAFKKSKIQPFEAWHVVKPWAENCPTAWPHDGLQHEKGSAKQQKDYYEEEGFNMLPEHATWEDGGNGVWAGIMELNNLMKSGRFKVVSSLVEWFEEMRQYHTKTTASGKSEIVKTKDDLLDATRYAYMMRRYAIRVCDLYPDAYMNQTNRSTGRDGLTGY